MAALATAALLGMTSVGAQAQSDYPSKPIRLIVGYSAGGPTDLLARLLGQDISTALGQPVIVENKPGASGNIATNLVQHAEPDGYTLVVNTIHHYLNPLQQPDVSKYDPIKDFTPVAQVVALPQIVVVAGDSPYKTLDDLVKKAKTQPNAVSYATAGMGGPGHLAGVLLEQRTQTHMTAVPFKGNSPALMEVMSGRVDFVFYPMVGVSEHVSAGKLRILAAGTAQRHPDYPDVPTMAELGFPGFDHLAQPVGFIGPAGLPMEVAQKFSDALAAALKKPATQEQLKVFGAQIMHRGPTEYRDWMEQDRDRWGQLLRSANLGTQ
nr:tripartite tricarboxylate transporter substrate binding protein [Pseudomonas sp.]